MQANLSGKQQEVMQMRKVPCTRTGKHGQQKTVNCGTFDKMVFLKNISDTSDGKKKQTSKTRRRPETQLGTSCHCKGRKLHRLKTRPGKEDRHFTGPFSLPSLEYSKHISHPL